MKIKVSEATGKALDYLVACVELITFPSLKHLEYPDDAPWFLHPDGTIRSAQEIPSNAMSRHYDYTFWSPSTDWAQGGPIIEREGMGLRYYGFDKEPYFVATSEHKYFPKKFGALGSTPLIAAMRCFVASKLGDEVDVPQALLA